MLKKIISNIVLLGVIWYVVLDGRVDKLEPILIGAIIAGVYILYKRTKEV
jgi:hypothetical protein